MELKTASALALLSIVVIASGCSSESPTGQATESPTLSESVDQAAASVSDNYISSIDGVKVKESDKTENSEGKAVVVNATISDGFFEDDYLFMAHGSSSIFQNVFGADKRVKEIGIRFYKEEPNKYGNIQRSEIGLTAMSRSTYERINWDNFKSENLQDVAQVRFKGDSPYLDLKESQERLERSQERLENLQDRYGGSYDSYQDYDSGY